MSISMARSKDKKRTDLDDPKNMFITYHHFTSTRIYKVVEKRQLSRSKVQGVIQQLCQLCKVYVRLYKIKTIIDLKILQAYKII